MSNAVPREGGRLPVVGRTTKFSRRAGWTDYMLWNAVMSARSAAMAGYELLNERASQRARVPGTLDRWLGQRFSG